MKAVSIMLKAIHAQEDRRSAEQKARQIARKLAAMKLKSAAGKVREGIADTLSYYDFPGSARGRS